MLAAAAAAQARDGGMLTSREARSNSGCDYDAPVAIALRETQQSWQAPTSLPHPWGSGTLDLSRVPAPSDLSSRAKGDARGIDYGRPNSPATADPTSVQFGWWVSRVVNAARRQREVSPLHIVDRERDYTRDPLPLLRVAVPSGAARSS